MTLHLWPSIWKWFDPKDPQGTFSAAIDSSLEYISAHISSARKAGKPLVLEEFGIVRDNSEYAENIPTTVRDRFFQQILSFTYDSARAGSPLAGTNFWAWGGEGRSINEDYMWNEGDPFTGDPPHEPQGMHSVFARDSSTSAIIRQYAKKMNRLGKIDTLFARSSYGTK